MVVLHDFDVSSKITIGRVHKRWKIVLGHESSYTTRLFTSNQQFCITPYVLSELLYRVRSKFKLKEDENIVYFTMCFEGTVNIPDNGSKKDNITEYRMVTGFHGSKSGHIFIPVHCIEYSDGEVKELLLREYIMSSKWFDGKLFEDETYLSYYQSDGAKQHFNELK